MRPGKAIRRVAALLPEALAPIMRSHGRCVAATRAGILALEDLGVAAEPLVVDVQAFNPAAVQWVLDGEPGGREGFKACGGYYLTTVRTPGAEHIAPTRRHVGTPWDHHLVAHVPSQRVLVDFDARQLARPEFNLHVPAALVVPWDGSGLAEMICENGARLVYAAAVDPVTGVPVRGFEDAPDWIHPADDIARDVARRAQKGDR